MSDQDDSETEREEKTKFVRRAPIKSPEYIQREYESSDSDEDETIFDSKIPTLPDGVPMFFMKKKNQDGSSSENGKIPITGEELLKNLLFNSDYFGHSYLNIVDEFADVEIFLISLDCLIVECLAHSYHNRDLAGQTLILCSQLDRFLDQLANVGGKFKLVVFTDLNPKFLKDSHLAFARTVAIAHLKQGVYGTDLLYFMSPIDDAWNKYLADMTPSFIMCSMENPLGGETFVNLAPYFGSIMFHALTSAIPVVLFTSFVINFKTVMAFLMRGSLRVFPFRNHLLASLWSNEVGNLKMVNYPLREGSAFASANEIWIEVIKLTKESHSVSGNFEILCSSVLLSSLICTRRGINRVYLPKLNRAERDMQRDLHLMSDARSLILTANTFLELMNCSSLPFPLNDFWDGRMILSLFDYISAGEAVLPVKLQEEFEKYRTLADLKTTLTAEDPLLAIRLPHIAKSPLLTSYVPEMADSECVEIGMSQAYKKWFEMAKLSWSFGDIPDDYGQDAEGPKTAKQKFKDNKNRQTNMRWYELFATSLEGRGHLQVDFTRTVSAISGANKEPTISKGWTGQKGNAGKYKKEKPKSKKEQIMEANQKTMEKKIIDDEKIKINYALQQGKQTVLHLENLYNSLQTTESKSICLVKMAKHEAKQLMEKYRTLDNLEERRSDCVNLVGYLKDCLVEKWEHLDEHQRQQVVDIWVSLGFEAPRESVPTPDALLKKLDLQMHMIYYQLEYGGQLIDIQSDPEKDDRVTGFTPDAWQRKMLDSVDKGNSSLIVAPTSAGKTFVSYYCMEKILRTSEEDVVVYVSPEKALMNQVCGSVYARFKTKAMSRGKALFGVIHPDYNLNALNCQILVTVPECLESLMLSTSPGVQEFVSRIRYVIFDEVHSIGASEDSHIWEHCLLLINCPFLALSATIGNVSNLHEWLSKMESDKTKGKRKVDLIQYGERYSELELSIVNIDKESATAVYEDDEDKESSKSSTPQPNYQIQGDLLQPFMPYSIYSPEKLGMFGIPDDQQLTAKQISHLYRVMAEVDASVKKSFEPIRYFGYKPNQPAWITRSQLRELENKLKEIFLGWVRTDKEKMQKTLDLFKTGTISEQLELRTGLFFDFGAADNYIFALADEMEDKNMLPAICFNDDGDVCELLATTIMEELEEMEEKYKESAEFKNLFNDTMREDAKQAKLAKRQRDANEKKRKGEKPEEEVRIEENEADPLESRKIKIAAILARFKLKSGVKRDQDLYRRAIERLHRSRDRASTKLLIRMFERGVAFHHARLNSDEKRAVEILFRAGYIAILFSTKTLALGVNMPCKTVLFGIDTFFLTPLLYRQMSGRAGRRGYDHKGSVVFLGVPTSKMRRLLTASLSNLDGNPPFDVTFILRLLAYVHPNNMKNVAGSIESRTQAVLSVLENSFSMHTRREASNGTLQKQIRLYFAYSIQMLRHLQLLDENCVAQNLASLACQLHKFAPGNLLFIHLLQKGEFHRLCTMFKDDKEKLKERILFILAKLFTSNPLPPSFKPGDRKKAPYEQAMVFLRDFPPNIQRFVDSFYSISSAVYTTYMASASPSNTFLDPVYKISGNSIGRKIVMTRNLVAPTFDGYSHDDSFLPVLPIDMKDHRERTMYYSAFAFDLYKYQDRKMLGRVHRIGLNRTWYDIHAFVEALRLLSTGLDAVGNLNDPVCRIVRELYTEYNDIFFEVFEMKKKFS